MITIGGQGSVPGSGSTSGSLPRGRDNVWRTRQAAERIPVSYSPRPVVVHSMESAMRRMRTPSAFATLSSTWSAGDRARIPRYYHGILKPDASTPQWRRRVRSLRTCHGLLVGFSFRPARQIGLISRTDLTETLVAAPTTPQARPVQANGSRCLLGRRTTRSRAVRAGRIS